MSIKIYELPGLTLTSLYGKCPVRIPRIWSITVREPNVPAPDPDLFERILK